MRIKIICIEYILWGIPTIESTFDVANMVKTVTVKDVPIEADRGCHGWTHRYGKITDPSDTDNNVTDNDGWTLYQSKY